MPGGWPQTSSHYDGHPLSLSLTHTHTHTHSCTHNWFGEDCTQHICDKVIEDGEAPLCGSGICLVNPSNISDYLCSCPLGQTGRNCQYNTTGGMCTCMHTCYQLMCVLTRIHVLWLYTCLDSNWLWVGVYARGGRLCRLGKVIGFNCQLPAG